MRHSEKERFGDFTIQRCVDTTAPLQLSSDNCHISFPDLCGKSPVCYEKSPSEREREREKERERNRERGDKREREREQI